MTASKKKQHLYLLLGMMGLSVALAAAGAFILTDAGQIFGISKEVVIAYFRAHAAIMSAAVALMLGALYLDWRWKLLRRWQAVAFALVVVGCLLATKFATPYIMFPSKQHTATYKKLTEVGDYLQPDDIVYVIEHKGDVRAYPQKLIWQAHIFGGDNEWDDIVFTYCVLTNLAIAYENDLNGQPMDLRVLAQTNNNLLLWDTRSGEIIQQITSVCDMSKSRLEPLPLVEMNWKAYQVLYPEGSVAYVQFSNPLERILHFLMPLENAHAGDNWMFNTVDVSNEILHSKEQIVGVTDGDVAVAYTRDYLEQAGVTNVQVGSKRLVIAHIPEHDIIVAFDRMRDGVEITVSEVDFFGNTKEHGKLSRAFVFNGPMWAVWAHYYPHTEVVK